MIADIVDVDGLFNTILDTCKDTSDIGFTYSTWAKAGWIWKQGFQELDPDPFMEALNEYGLPWVVVENPQMVD